MGLIDKKLAKLGFSLQEGTRFNKNYIRKVFGADGKDTGYTHQVEISYVFSDGNAKKPGGEVRIRSSILGRGCPIVGFKCSEPLTFKELYFFSIKTIYLVIKWKLELMKIKWKGDKSND